MNRTKFTGTIAAITVLWCLSFTQAQGPYAVTWNAYDTLTGSSQALNYRLDGTASVVSPDTVIGNNYQAIHRHQPTMPPSTWSMLLITADFNFDFRVDIDDVLFFVMFWLNPACGPQNAWCAGADFNRDHAVNLLDLLVLIQNWLHIETLLINQFPLDSDPGWTTQGQWQFGRPLGLGGTENGYPDPNSGFTGENVYGVNLAGNYFNEATAGPFYLTTRPIDVADYENIRVRFARWLNTDDPAFVASRIEVSVNGTDWSILWEHTAPPPPGQASITDSQWTPLEYPLGSAADNQPTLWIRWGYEILNGPQAFSFSGWNIDDIEFWGNLSKP